MKSLEYVISEGYSNLTGEFRSMLIRRPETTPGKPMTMDGVKDVTMRMMVGGDDGAPTFAMRHFTVEPGGHTPRHSHNYEHEVVVLNGSAKVEHGGEFHDVSRGDILMIEPNVTHQFVNHGDEPFQFLCFVPNQFDCGGGAMERTPGS